MNTVEHPIDMLYGYRKSLLLWSIAFFAVTGWSIAIGREWFLVLSQAVIGVVCFAIYVIVKRQVLALQSKPDAVVKEREPIHYITFSSLHSYPRGEYVYVLHDTDVTGMFKIGRTADPEKRILNFGVHLPFTVGIVHIIPTDNMVQLETMLHRRFASKRVKGEWFILDGDDLDYIWALGLGKVTSQ